MPRYVLVIKDPEQKNMEELLATRQFKFIRFINHKWEATTVLAESDKSEHETEAELNKWVAEENFLLHIQGSLLFWNRDFFEHTISNKKGEGRMIKWNDLHKIIPNLSELGFSFSNYYIGEREIINPALEKLGYTKIKDWYSTEKDSFGPLSRGSIWKKDNETFHFVYG